MPIRPRASAIDVRSSFDLPDWVRVCEGEFDYVYRTLRRCGARAADAEDLAQEVFLTMWRRRDSFDPSRPVRPWIAGISFRIFSEHRRRFRREVPGGLVDVPDERPGPDDDAGAAQARALVLQALSSLTEPQRTVLVLHDLDGTPMREIAGTLSVPLFTLYSRLKSARRAFAKAVRRAQLRPSLARAFAVAAPEALLAAERRLAAAPSRVKRRTLARLRALGPAVPRPLAPPRAPWQWPRTATATMATAGLVLLGLLMAPARPAPLAGVAAQPLSHWRFDEPATSSWAGDATGRGNDCQLRGLDPARAWRPGVAGGALAFSDHGWLECPHSGALAGLTGELTVAAWVTAGSRPTGYHAVVARQQGQGREDQLFFGFRDDELVFASNTWGVVFRRRLPRGLGPWFHVAASRHANGTLVLYAGGVELGRTATAPGRLPGGNNPLLLGAERNTARPDHTEGHFDGALDELRLYDRALSGADVAALAATRGSLAVVP